VITRKRLIEAFLGDRKMSRPRRSSRLFLIRAPEGITLWARYETIFGLTTTFLVGSQTTSEDACDSEKLW